MTTAPSLPELAPRPTPPALPIQLERAISERVDGERYALTNAYTMYALDACWHVHASNQTEAHHVLLSHIGRNADIVIGGVHECACGRHDVSRNY